MSTAIRAASLMLTGIFAGFMAGVLALELSLRSFDGTVYTQVRLVELEWLDTFATFTLLPAIAATAAAVVQVYRRGSGGAMWGAVALALLVSVVVISAAVNLPINAEQLDWSVVAPPADWAQVRDRWQIAHLVRTVAAVAAFICLIGIAEMSQSRRGASRVLGAAADQARQV
ncbi:anthrone oxygenase family protein [Nocardia gipuzkoensis]